MQKLLASLSLLYHPRGTKGRWLPKQSIAVPTARAALMPSMGSFGFYGNPAPHRPPSHYPFGCYQSKEIAFNHREAEKHVWLILEGNASKGNRAPKVSPLTQRGTMGFCPCCVIATYVAVPALFNWGDFLTEKAPGAGFLAPTRPVGGLVRLPFRQPFLILDLGR